MEALIDTNYAGLKGMLHSAETRFLHCVSSSTDNASAPMSVSNILREKNIESLRRATIVGEAWWNEKLVIDISQGK